MLMVSPVFVWTAIILLTRHQQLQLSNNGIRIGDGYHRHVEYRRACEYMLPRQYKYLCTAKPKLCAYDGQATE